MKHIQETQTADGTVTERRWIVDGADVTETEFDTAPADERDEKIKELADAVSTLTDTVVFLAMGV